MKTFSCIKCKFSVPFATVAKNIPYKCGNCRNLQYTAVYPAMFSEAEKGREAEKLLIDEHATCFFHQDKVATVSCDECGVFLCSLCDLHLEKKHFCPKCFKENKNKIASLQSKTFLYDDMMLGLALLPLLLFYITIITAPVAIGGSIYFWNKVSTPYKRGKWRFVVAVIVSMMELAGWAVLLIVIFSR